MPPLKIRRDRTRLDVRCGATPSALMGFVRSSEVRVACNSSSGTNQSNDRWRVALPSTQEMLPPFDRREDLVDTHGEVRTAVRTLPHAEERRPPGR